MGRKVGRGQGFFEGFVQKVKVDRYQKPAGENAKKKIKGG
jgi:hypothetical protein